MPIFQDQNGLAVKFFIQKDLPQETQAELCEMITTLGGRVESKVPRQGYILVQPGTVEEERLRLCWTSPDRPDRHFVPYTYVEACKISGMLLKQIFVQDGIAIKMHIHPSIANINARSALSHRIMHSGGDATATAQSARVILADPNTEVFQHLVKIYQDVPDKYIESYLWVKKCIEKGALTYTPLVYKNPGGRRPGEERIQFTDDDEQRLCKWIAEKIPYKATGGRTGNKLYQQLCEMSNNPGYSWVSRHTWQSWRERYKKNAERLDRQIDRYVDETRPAPGEKGQYGYVRQAEAKSKKTRRKRGNTNENNLIQGQYVEPRDIGAIGPMPMIYAIPMDEHYNPGIHAPIQSLPMPAPPPPSSSIHAPADAASVRRSPAEEEMEEDPDFVNVRVGTEPPPLWGKRKVSEANDSRKRPKSSYVDPTLRHKFQPHLQNNGEQPSQVHFIDQNIRDIAQEFRFTVNEVQEYYDKCGEMSRTRRRFEKMRQKLTQLEDEDD